MKSNLLLEERLIVAADFHPKKCGGISGVKAKVLSLAQELEGLGVYIKVNSILRAIGYDLIVQLHELGLKVFADLKLVDIPNTMATDGAMLAEVHPEIVTVMCNADIKGMHAVHEALKGKTKVLGVTVLTSLNEEDCQAVFTCSTRAGVLRFARLAQGAKLEGLILSPKEVDVVINRFELSLELNTPGIRPKWSIIGEDDQSRVLTPKDAIKNGADRIVIGRPIVQASPNNDGFPKSPREAVERTLEEIREGISES